MVANWQTLPVELLQTIFFNFNDDKRNPNLYQCQLVCKSWAPTAQRELYTKVKVKSATCMAAVDLALEMNGLDLGKYVKTLQFSSHTTQTANLLDDWQDIETKFPKLTCFSMDRPSKNYYSRIRQAHKDGKWPLLGGICRPLVIDEQLMEDYLNCVLAYRQNVTGVYLSDDGERDNRIEVYNKFLKQLNTIPKLKCLQLIKQISDSIDSLDPVIEGSSPNLENVHLGLTTNEDYLLGNIHEPATIDMSHIKPRPKVKRFTMMGVIDRDRDLLYIMRKYPNLQHFYINSYEDTNVISNIVTSMLFRDPPGTTRFTPTVLANFIYFATKVPIHNLQHFPVTIEIAAEALLKYWTLLTKEEVQQQQQQDEREMMKKSLTLRYKSSQYRPEFVQTVNSLLDIHDHNIGVLFTHLNGTATLPHVDILAKCGHLISHLNLSFDNNLDMLSHVDEGGGGLEEDQEDEKEEAKDHGYYVDQIIQQYTQQQFKKLVLDKCIMKGLNFTSTLVASTSSITQLYFYYSKINMYLFSQLSTKLPNLKELHLICCTFTDQNGNEEKNHIDIKMPNTSLNVLSIQHYTLPRIFFKLSMTNSAACMLSSGVPKKAAMEISENLYETSKHESLSVHFQCHYIDWFHLFNIARKEPDSSS